MFNPILDSTRKKTLGFALLVSAVFMGAATPSEAQADNVNGAVKITLVATSNPPQPGGRIMVIRRATGDPRRMIVLPEEGATAEDLAIAFGSLSKAMTRDGDVLAHPEQRITVSGSVDAPLGVQQQRFEAMLDKLARSRLRFISGLGTVRAADVSFKIAHVTSP